ncbi:MAG: hypothetical protein MHM6MM_008478, partial [Cercozoa sp. M6MM]
MGAADLPCALSRIVESYAQALDLLQRQFLRPLAAQLCDEKASPMLSKSQLDVIANPTDLCLLRALLRNLLKELRSACE